MSHGYVKTPGGWQVASAYYVKVAGVWRPVTNTYVRVNGIWKQSFPAAAPPPPPPPPPPPAPTPPPPAPPGGGGGLVSCVSIGFYYCNGASVVAGGAVCGTENGVAFGGCTTGSCCSYWQNLSGNPSNWICGASGSVNQPTCSSGGGGCTTPQTFTGGNCYCDNNNITDICSPCTSLSQTGPCGNRFSAGLYCGTSYGSSAVVVADPYGTCASGNRNATYYQYSDTYCNSYIYGACVGGGGCPGNNPTSGQCYCSSADVNNACSPCTSTFGSGPCGNYYTGGAYSVAPNEWYCTESYNGGGIGNCGYTMPGYNNSASGSGYSRQCTYGTSYPACQSTGAAAPPPPPPPPPPPAGGCTFSYTYTEYRSSCGGQATITVYTNCAETFVCSGATPPPPPPPPPAVDCNTCVSYGGACGTYGNGTLCITPGACPNLCQGDYNPNPVGGGSGSENSGGGTPTPPPDPGPLVPPGGDFSGGWQGKSVNISTLVRTPDGLAPAGSVEVGDVLLSADITGFPYEELAGANLAAINWTGKNPDIATVETTVVNVVRRTAPSGVMINNDLFSNTHYVLIKRGAKAMFILSSEVFMEDKVYNYSSSSWENITQLRKADIPHEVVSIDCEPYDVFYTERMLVHDSNTIE